MLNLKTILNSLVLLLFLSVHSRCTKIETKTVIVEDGGDMEIKLEINEFIVIKRATWAIKSGHITSELELAEKKLFEKLANRYSQYTESFKKTCDRKRMCTVKNINSQIPDGIKSGLIDFVVVYERGRFCPHYIFESKHVFTQYEIKVPNKIACFKEKNRDRNIWIFTTKMDLFLKTGVKYEIHPGNVDICRFTPKTTTYHCTTEINLWDRESGCHKWTCGKSFMATAEHSTSSGHWLRTLKQSTLTQSTNGLESERFHASLINPNISPVKQFTKKKFPSWEDFITSNLWSFMHSINNFSITTKHFLFNDDSHLLFFKSWCELDNSIDTVLENIAVPSMYLLPPPYSSSIHPLQGCHGGMFASAEGHVKAIITVWDYRTPPQFQVYVTHPNGSFELCSQLNNELKNANTFNDAYEIIKTQDFMIKNQVECVKSTLTFDYDEETHHLIAKGGNITMSEVVKNENWKEASSIDVFALHQISIDTNISKAVNMFFFAPKWQIAAVPVHIVLSGENGRNYPNAANDAIGRRVKGDDGKPGLPGESSGNFFGAGISFENLHNLHIHAVGGTGGNGQTGGRGSPGISGKDASVGSCSDSDQSFDPLKDIHFEYNCHDYHSVVLNDYSLLDRICDVYGEKIVALPGDGGNGGIGGLGGNAGEIKLLGGSLVSNHSKQGTLSHQILFRFLSQQ